MSDYIPGPAMKAHYRCSACGRVIVDRNNPRMLRGSLEPVDLRACEVHADAPVVTWDESYGRAVAGIQQLAFGRGLDDMDGRADELPWCKPEVFAVALALYRQWLTLAPPEPVRAGKRLFG